MRVKKAVVDLLTLRLTAQGFSISESRRWIRSVYRQKFVSKEYSREEKNWALKRGFLPAQVKSLGLTEDNYKDTISAKEYAFLRPLNGGYSKWITDKVTINTIFKPFRDVMPKYYYQIYERDNSKKIIPLFDYNAEDTVEAIIKLLKEKKQLRIRQTNRSRSFALSYIDDTFYFVGKPMTEAELAAQITSFGATMVVTEEIVSAEEFEGVKIRLIVFNEQGDNPVIGDSYLEISTMNKIDYMNHADILIKMIEDDDLSDVDEGPEEVPVESDMIYAHIDKHSGKIGTPFICKDGAQIECTLNPNTGMKCPQQVPHWEEIVKTIDKLCKFVPQLEFFGVNIVISEDGFKIMDLLNHPSYPHVFPFSKETSAYLKGKVAQKQAAYAKFSVRLGETVKKVKLKIRSTYCKTFFPNGLLPYLSIRWFQDLKKDFLTNKDTTFSEKMWALKHGFISYRIPQYGITKENHKEFISDFEYKWLRHINNKYRHWMEDKITVKYICSKYNYCFPEYYYHISLKNGNNKIVPMMDCPECYHNTYEDIAKLVQEKGMLALKPDEGSHGDGFYKLSYQDGKYYLNHEEAQWEDVLKILQDVNNQYLITEYIDMHDEIKRIYDGAVNTIRMIVFKKDGKTPVIGNAYMRFGSKRTGAVDNMGAGGMFAKIDIETGRFYDAKIIEANEIKSCPYHPDTNVKIDGYLPNWEKVKQDVLNVAADIPQLEFFGFDLAITKDGLKFPEINRFPDYPAIEKYTPQTIDYLLYKLEQKKKKYGYDVSRGNKLIKLPER